MRQFRTFTARQKADFSIDADMAQLAAPSAILAYQSYAHLTSIPLTQR